MSDMALHERQFEVILVDLDDTVYPRGSGVMHAVGQRIHQFMVEVLQMGREQAASLRKEYFTRYGTTLRGLQIHHEIDSEHYLDYVHQIPLEQLVCPDPQLDRALGQLPQTKVIFTNASTGHAENVLRHMGLRHHFSQIIDVTARDYLNKPDIEAYKVALDLVAAPAEACVMVEDSLRNLEPAQQMGMGTVLVGQDGAAENGADVVIQTLADLPDAMRYLKTLQS